MIRAVVNGTLDGRAGSWYSAFAVFVLLEATRGVGDVGIGGRYWLENNGKLRVISTDGENGGSSLAIQGANHYSMEGRKFGIVSGTEDFTFVKGYGIMDT
ncbi:unnamed protein product [Malus baccata var. baccata]